MTHERLGVSELEKALRTAFAPEHLHVEDESHRHAGHAGARSGGGHYVATIVSPRFEGLSAIERHRLVYAALGDAMRTSIHALALTTRTPAEWSRRER